MTTIYVFGNPLVKEDSLPLGMIDRLRAKFPSLEFKEFDTTEDLDERDLIIIDTIMGIRNVELIDDIGKIITDKVYSMHDFDLGQTLKLMKKANMIDSVRILGIPMNTDEKKAFLGLCELISKILIKKNHDLNMRIDNWKDLNGLIEYPSDGILSKEIFKTQKMDVTLFCMSKGSNISDHTSKKEGLVFVLEGRGIFYLEDKKLEMKPNVLIPMKRSAVHSLKATKNTSFVLMLF